MHNREKVKQLLSGGKFGVLKHSGTSYIWVGLFKQDKVVSGTRQPCRWWVNEPYSQLCELYL